MLKAMTRWFEFRTVRVVRVTPSRETSYVPASIVVVPTVNAKGMWLRSESDWALSEPDWALAVDPPSSTTRPTAAVIVSGDVFITNLHQGVLGGSLNSRFRNIRRWSNRGSDVEARIAGQVVNPEQSG
jgi:hypothetical protein